MNDEPDVFVFPTSSVQRRLWLSDQFESGGAVYNTPLAFRLSGALDLAALRASFDEIVHRHESLRTGFARQEGTVVQRIISRVEIPMPVVDLEKRPDREAECQRLLNDEARQPFDLARAPLIRVRVFRLAANDHVLAITSHHTVFDGWSEGVLFNELQALYQAFRQGQPSPLPELPIQYADYAVWQNERLTGEELERQRAYWKKQTAGLGVLELPVDRPRPSVQTFRGALQGFSFPPELEAALKSVGQRENATLFMTLVAAFQVLLHRYSGQNDLSVGTIVSGRDRSELEGMIGCFINTLVLRADLSGDPTFRQFLGRVREAALGSYAHQDLPFEMLVEGLEERDASRSPLFQVLLIQAPAPREQVLGDLLVRRVPVDPGVSKFELTATLSTDDGTAGIEGRLEYNSDLFEAGTIERFLRHYQSLLAGIAADADTRLSRLPLLTEQERAAQCAWNSTAVEVSDAPVDELIARQAALQPDRVAVEAEGTGLSYAELMRRSDHLAGHLRARGVAPGVCVGVYMERSPEMVVGLLAVWKAGGAYLPLDPGFPAERLAYMVEDSGAALVLTHAAVADSAPAGAEPVVLEVQAGLPLSSESRVAERGARPDDLAYVIYTSGSTGRPKGVAVTHRSLVNLLESMRREPGLRETDVLLSVTTLSFDIAALELYLPLITGARVSMASRDDALDGRRLMDRLSASGATLMQATPASWRLLLEAGWTGSRGLRILCGGEALTRDLADRLLACAAEVWNVYGPTETTVWSSVSRVEPGDAAISIGRPIANTQMWVLDAHLQPMPVGVPGELYIGGMGVARGYWQRDELTAARFVADPFSAHPGARLYRTGDMARRRSDGSLECLGRLDNQVKIRGFRIELGEVETALTNHPAVAQAVVVVTGRADTDRRLVGYVVLRPGAAATGSELRRHLRRQVPDYMLPGFIVEIAEIPLTPNGKVDRKALPDPFLGTRPEREVVEPQSSAERAIAKIWQEALGLDRVGLYDNFFDLGGHSLLSMQVLGRMERELGWCPQPRSMIIDTLRQIAAAFPADGRSQLQAPA